MEARLVELNSKSWQDTKHYIQGVAHVISSLQRAFVPEDPHEWQYGLKVSLRGLVSGALKLPDETIHASLDLVKLKLRLGDTNWKLEDHSPTELMNNVKVWLNSHGVNSKLDEPPLQGPYSFDAQTAHSYAHVIWWMNNHFEKTKEQLKPGLTSPILLYPHHFDLSLSWFPDYTDKQRSLGFSGGDDIIAEPYLYLTSYPDSDSLKNKTLPDGTRWQERGFSGVALPYPNLLKSADPERLFKDFSSLLLTVN